MRKQFYIGTFLIVIASHLVGQEVAAKLDLINKTYDAYSSYSSEVKYEYYDSLGAQQASETSLGLVLQKESYSYYKIGDVEIYVGADYTLQIDHGLKEINYMKSHNEYNRGGLQVESYRKSLELCQEATLVEIGKLDEIVVKGCAGSDYSEMRIKYFRKTQLIQSIVFVRKKEGNILVVTYDNTKVNEAISTEKFSLSKFISGEKGSAILTQEYTGYEFNNYFN